jgi:hypothetical protein
MNSSLTDHVQQKRIHQHDGGDDKFEEINENLRQNHRTLTSIGKKRGSLSQPHSTQENH